MIYGYARVSTKGQERTGNSLTEQTDAIRDRYSDAIIQPEAYSGAKERPIFNGILEQAVQGDAVVVTKLDRFCRSTKEGLQYIDYLMDKGVRIHILNMGLIENTPMGRMIVTQLLAFAEFERSMILERTSGGKEEKRRKDPNYREGRHKIPVPDFDQFYSGQKNGTITVDNAIAQLGISRATWYRLARAVTA